MEEDRQSLDADSELQRRRIILQDGRYMIFYTFGPETGPQSQNSEAEAMERNDDV